MDEYLKTTRRKRSEALCEAEARARSHSGSLVTRGAVTSVSRAQRLLQTGRLARQGGPLVPERLELHIPAIRHSTVTMQVRTEGGVTIRGQICVVGN